MGRVYRARDPQLNRDVAIKILHAGKGSSGGGLEHRLLREAQAMARLNHPHLATIYDVGTIGGEVFIAFEFIDGTTLAQWLAQPGRALRERLDALLAAGRGLAAAHTAGVVHRDFKPDNVMVGRAGGVKVVDFGLARGVEGAAAEPAPPASGPDALAANLTQTGAILGTPLCMSPEQLLTTPPPPAPSYHGRHVRSSFVPVLLLVCQTAFADSDAKGVVDRWLAAQNQRKFDDYKALYAPGFHGVRRSGDKTVFLDHDGWLRDRKRMFKKPLSVTIDKLELKAAADGTHVTFVQTFDSGTYHDVGDKEMVIVEGKITREEMLASSKVAVCDTIPCGRVSGADQAAILGACDKLCQAGDSWGCRAQAFAARDGECGAAKDAAKAQALFSRTCDAKDEMSCRFAAELVLDKDPAGAAAFYGKGCAGEDGESCYALALMLREGKGLKKDVERAVELMDKLCTEENRSGPGSSSCYELEDMYKHGKGVKKDKKAAREYHRIWEQGQEGE